MLTARELEPYHFFERTKKEFPTIKEHGSSPEDLALVAAQIYFSKVGCVADQPSAGVWPLSIFHSEPSLQSLCVCRRGGGDQLLVEQPVYQWRFFWSSESFPTISDAVTYRFSAAWPYRGLNPSSRPRPTSSLTGTLICCDRTVPEPQVFGTAGVAL
jgi:hypothetical protein